MEAIYPHPGSCLCKLIECVCKTNWYRNS